ncbi:MAG TPA: hypothetical protein PK520_00285 [Exilispira sp.]|nr:hypothetical protein [Exilispira sp.]HPB47884.1 hypothetical protein [Exilispira sp.]HPO60494.1 hypothetical protein [Exilispira sp.]HQQ18510.1 hypothetical protein [Exilispira sp.]
MASFNFEFYEEKFSESSEKIEFLIVFLYLIMLVYKESGVRKIFCI